jgi:predicted RNase H-like nuclease
MLQERGNIREMIAEGHPELAFMSINPDQRTLSPKGTPEGVQERCSLINKLISGDITEKCASLLRDHRREATIVDCLDATALVLMLAQGGGGISFIGDGARDEVGLPMRIAAKVRDKR